MSKRYQLVFWSWLNWTNFRRASLTKDWIHKRFRLWQRTALRSILAQDFDDWRYVLLCDERSAHHTGPLAEQIDDERVSLVHGVDGERAWREQLPEAQHYVVARLDSDDRYHPRAGRMFLRNAFRASKGRPFLQYNEGYAHDAVRKELYAWVQRSSPFYARVVGPGYRTMDWLRPPPHHSVRGRAIQLGAGHFIVTIHGRNTSTNARCPCIGGPLPLARARRVAKQFGLGRVVVAKAKKRAKPWHGLTQRDLPSEVRVNSPLGGSVRLVRRR